MASITYNGQTDSNLVTFTDVPNIVKVAEDPRGTCARISFTVSSYTPSADSQFYITILGETITNVLDAASATNKRFYLTSQPYSNAYGIAKALRNCGKLGADFNILSNEDTVYLTSKTIGYKITSSDVSNNMDISPTITTGTVSGYTGTKLSVDVYSGRKTIDNYVTTLEKNFYGSECAFNMSPVLATMAEYGVTKQYSLALNVISKTNSVTNIFNTTDYITVGYKANQSANYMSLPSTSAILINENRSIILYTYKNVIDFSILGSGSTYTVSAQCYDSVNQTIGSVITSSVTKSDSYITDASIEIPRSTFNSADYVKISVGESEVNFHVIKPLKATEYCQRVYWRNEYGGISFFDFTGSKSESDSLEIETYEKNIFDYYDNTDVYEKKRIYSNDYNKSVTLTSHLMKENGKWIFNSLVKSKKLWTDVNNSTYYIIPKSVEVTEDQTYNGIYTGKLTYEYSDI